jgi:PKD repeat protein
MEIPQTLTTMRSIILTLCLLFFSGIALPAFSQKEPEKKVSNPLNTVDYRIDNIMYWKKMAEKGLVPFSPVVPMKPAEYKGTKIEAKGLNISDSPDVPVTSLTSVTESENSVFVDPDNNQYMLNSNNSTNWSGGTVGTLYGADYLQTSDGGATYGGSTSGAGGSNSGDPTTAINHAGRQFVNYIDDPGGQGIAYSDNGSTWSTSTIAPNPGSLADKNHMWIDNKTTSPYAGNLYVAWTDFGGSYNYQAVFSRSTNNGSTWSTRIPISGSISTFNHGVNLKTGPAGQVYACWATYPSSGLTENGIGFNKSTDGGATFGTAYYAISNIKGIRETGVLKSMRVNSFPVMECDISGGAYNGNIYIVWTNIGVPGTNTGTNKSVYIIRSSDGGTTWATPVRVNQGPFADGKEAYCPWITCDPETGNLAVIFYDDRNTASTACETWVAYSVDAGATWTDFRVSDVSFTPTPIPGLASSYMGDYLGITSKGGRVYPCWTDTRGGLFMTYVSPFTIGLNAAFTASSTSVCSGSSVTFTEQSSGPPTSWTWSFPGGTPSSYNGKTPPAIVYNTPGTYDVSLTVTDATGTDTETKTGYITVKNVFADFSGTPTSVVIGNTASFTDYSTCSPTAWSWSFPGGTPSTYSGQTPPAITYSTLGTYDVSLTVTKGSSNDTKTKTGYITVTPPIYIMSNSTVYACSGNFYDPGGSSGSYANSTDYTMTFYPSTTGSFLRFVFNSFDLESEATCSYDYLKVYDGTSTSATLLGTYCGTTGPGTVTATNSSGAITFVFHSDVSVVGTGWDASLSCVTGVVANPPTFTATAAGTAQINLAWTQNASANSVMVVWNSSNTFGIPVDGTVYTGGSTVTGGGTVLYRGSSLAFNHTLLNPNTTYYYKAFSYDGSNVYSSGVTANATTACGIFSLPLSESFASSSMPNCWSQQVTGTNGVNSWTVSATNNAGGTANEMKSTYQSVNPGTTLLVTPPLNTLGMSQLNLSFKHFLDAYGTGCTLRIQSSMNGSTWTNEAWSVASTSSNVGPATVNTTVLSNLNSATTYIAFEIDGNLYQYDYWYIDDVSITGVTANTLTVTPSNQNVTAAAGTTNFTVTSNTSWTATSDQTWCTVTPSGTGNGTLAATYTQNTLITSRVANITVTVSGLTPVVVTVTQAGAAPTLTVTPSNQNVPGTTAGSTSFTVTSNTSWTVTSDQTWCTVTPSGTGNGAITAGYTVNPNASSRIANITVTVTGLTPVVVTVTQAGNPTLTVTPSNQNVTASAGSTSFSVTSNTTWTVSSSQSWCTVTPAGSGNGTITANYTQNISCPSRVANITVTVAGLTPVVVTVTQATAPPPVLTSGLTPPPICTNTVFSYNPTSSSPGTVFAWTRAAVSGISNPSASGYNNPNEVLINITNQPVTVYYVYTLTANSCVNNQLVTVVVEPRPTVAVSGGGTMCSGSVPSGPPPLPGEHGSGGDSGFPGVSFAFTGVAPWNLTYSDGTTNHTVTGITNNPYVLTVSPSVTSTYTATALSDANCSATPDGLTGSAIVTVNPVPVVNPVANQVTWNGATTAAIIFTGTATSYQWTNDLPSIGLAASGTGNIAPFTAINPGLTAVIATITVLPMYTYGGVTCTGTPVTFTITVNPTPTLNVTPSNQDVTDPAGSTAFSLISNTSWTALSDQIWCSVTPSGTGNGTLTAWYTQNFSSSPRIAHITVTVAGLTPVVVTVTQAGVPFKNVSITLFIEGLFNPATGIMLQAQESTDGMTTFNKFPGLTADTLSVILANSTDPWSYVYQVHGLAVNDDGTLSFVVPSSFSDNYYLVIRQRNSVETWSGLPVSFAGSTINYNFTTSAGQAFGNNLKKMLPESNVFALYTGDVTSMVSSQDGYIDIFDNAGIFNNAQQGLYGYISDDLNGDAFVDIFDLAVVFNNMQIGAGMITPPNPGKKK